MEPTLPDSTPPPRLSLGLAIASLVLGILALALSFLVIGGLLGLVGLALGIAHLTKKRRPVVMAWFGIVLSALGLLAGIGFTVLYYRAYQQFEKMMQSESTNDSGAELDKWQGVMAPDFSVTTLDGQTMKVSQFKGKRLVLDFWATWCPPCRKEIPHFIKLFNQTSRDDLVVLGISDEDPQTLRSFVAKNGMDYPVASAKDLPPPYSGLQYIPTTFFIDRKGVIQTIAVGYHDYDQLKQDALAPDFSGIPKSAPAGPTPLPDAVRMLKPSLAWSKNISGAQTFCVGNWDGGSAPRVLVAAGSTLHVLNLNGAEISTLSLPEPFSIIECGQNKADGACLLGYDNWGSTVDVIDTAGRKLWSVRAPEGVDGAHWGDLNGDGNDDLIVGMNGGGGLQAWSAKGKKLWTADLGNVWNQAVLPATQQQPARVLATEAGGTVRIYDTGGDLLTTLQPNGGYYSQMDACRAADNTIQIVAINNNNTVAFDNNGKVLWTTTAIANHAGWRTASFATGDVTGDGKPDWAFIDGSGSLVIANQNGQKISAIPDAAGLSAFAIASCPGQNGLLITLDGSTVNAYTFKP